MKGSEANTNIHKNSEIVAALKEGDKQVFELVYRHYFGGLYAFCSQYVSHNEAEEIVQDTMLWLWESRSCLLETLTLKSLLFTIVKNKALNRICHHEIRRKVHTEIIEKYERELAEPDFYLENELFALYEKALSKLPNDLREAFELNRSHELTYKEIALRLNVSHQTVNYRIGQALKFLRKELRDYLP